MCDRSINPVKYGHSDHEITWELGNQCRSPQGPSTDHTHFESSKMETRVPRYVYYIVQMAVQGQYG